MRFSCGLYKYIVFSFMASLLLSNLAIAKTKAYAKKTKKKPQIVTEKLEESFNESYDYVNARVSFRHHDYNKSLAFLTNPTNDKEKLLVAEAHFRLHDYVNAKNIYSEVYNNLENENDKKVSLIRIFECALALGDKNAAEKIYQIYLKNFKRVPEKLTYALGYAFINENIKKSSKFLRKIPAKSEYGIRAKYLLATMNIRKLEKKPVSIAIKPFDLIIKMPLVSVEDNEVLIKSKLAKARIYAQRYMYNEAFNTYSAIGFNDEDIVQEVLEVLFKKANDVAGGLGPYKNVSEDIRSQIEYQSLEKAFEVVSKFKEFHGNDFFSSKIISLVLKFYSRSNRYDEAKAFFDAVLSYYDSLKLELEYYIKKSNLLPVFDLSMNHDKKNIISNMPAFHIAKTNQIDEILNIKNDIIKTKNIINNYQNKMDKINLDKILANQKDIENDYLQKTIKLQSKILKETLVNVENFKKEILYEKALLADLKSKDFKKQLDIIWDYETKAQQNFNDNLKKMQQENLNETSKEVNKNGGSL